MKTLALILIIFILAACTTYNPRYTEGIGECSIEQLATLRTQAVAANERFEQAALRADRDPSPENDALASEAAAEVAAAEAMADIAADSCHE